LIGRQCIPAQAELFEHAGAEVLDHDVGLGDQLMDDLAARRMLEIDRHRLLVARLHVPPQRGAFVELAPLAQGVAAIGRFDLDHLGAELGHDARGEGPAIRLPSSMTLRPAVVCSMDS
jgi:hypothetical protein